MSLLNEPGGLTVGPAAVRTWPSRSLVEVLPDEPVMPSVRRPPVASRAGTAAASRADAAGGQPPHPRERVAHDDARHGRLGAGGQRAEGAARRGGGEVVVPV